LIIALSNVGGLGQVSINQKITGGALMRVSQAIKDFYDYHRMNSKKNTIRNYEPVVSRFSIHFGERELEPITTEEILVFLTQFTEGVK
jgi:hypothetical protein